MRVDVGRESNAEISRTKLFVWLWAPITLLTLIAFGGPYSQATDLDAATELAVEEDRDLLSEMGRILAPFSTYGEFLESPESVQELADLVYVYFGQSRRGNKNSSGARDFMVERIPELIKLYPYIEAQLMRPSGDGTATH